jgi:DNA-directed RNA polymerase subunit beta
MKTTGEVYAEAGDEITSALSWLLSRKMDIQTIPTLDIDHVNVGAYLRNTLIADKNMNREDALVDIYRILRPGEPPTIEGAHALFRGFFFDNERYDLSSVGRVKMNSRLGLDVADTVRILRKEDIVAIIKVLLDLKDGREQCR